MTTKKEITRDLYIKLYNAGNEDTKNWLRLNYSNGFSIYDTLKISNYKYNKLRQITTNEQNKILDEAYGTVYNNWYTNTQYPKTLLYITENNGVHGFNKDGIYINMDITINPLISRDLIQATEEQIKNTFLKECEKRGFLKGTKYTTNYNSGIKEIQGTLKVYKKSNNILQITDGFGGSVYYKGSWANIVEEKYKVGQIIKMKTSQNEYMITQLYNGEATLINLNSGYLHYKSMFVKNINEITKKEIEDIVQ